MGGCLRLHMIVWLLGLHASRWIALMKSTPWQPKTEEVSRPPGDPANAIKSDGPAYRDRYKTEWYTQRMTRQVNSCFTYLVGFWVPHVELGRVGLSEGGGVIRDVGKGVGGQDAHRRGFHLDKLIYTRRVATSSSAQCTLLAHALAPALHTPSADRLSGDMNMHVAYLSTG